METKLVEFSGSACHIAEDQKATKPPCMNRGFLADSYEITVPPLVVGSCSDCDLLSGVHTLEKSDIDECVYLSTRNPISSVCDDISNVVLQFEKGDKITLTVQNVSGSAIGAKWYLQPRRGFHERHFLEPWVLPLEESSGSCTGWPDTIEVTAL